MLRCWDKAEAYAADACRLYAITGNKVMLADSQRHVGLGQWFGGRPQAAVATLRESLAFSQQLENRWGQADCASKMMIPLAEIGRYGEAIKVGRQGVEQTRQIGEPIMTHLQAALALAQEMGLPGEEWPILGALGGLYAGRGDEVQAQQAYKTAAVIIYRLAETIDENDLREGFFDGCPGAIYVGKKRGDRIVVKATLS